MDEKFISRKQRRKMERTNKKQKKDDFYKNRFGVKGNPAKNRGNVPADRKKSVDSNVSWESAGSIVYRKGSVNSIGSDVKESTKNNNERKNKNESKFKGKGKDDVMDDIEMELVYLEKKWKLNSKDKVEKFTKTWASDNYDPDIWDFLDNIDNVCENNDLDTYKKQNHINDDDEDSENSGDASGDEDDDDEEGNWGVKGKYSSKTHKNNENKEKPRSVLQKTTSQTHKPQAMTSKHDNKTLEELNIKLQKDLTSLINKIAESNISFIILDIYKHIDSFISSSSRIPSSSQWTTTKTLYDTITNVSLKLLLNQEITNLPITSCICSFISLLHFKFGNAFIYYYLKSWLNEISYFQSQETAKHKIKNAIFQLIHFYIFQNITSSLIYDTIKYFIQNFNDNSSEYLLLLLSYTGIEIRKEDPENLKHIFTEITKEYNNLKLDPSNNTLSKIKYIVDMIEDIKANKYWKFNLSDKFAFFKNFVSSTSSASNAVKKGDKIEITITQIQTSDFTEILNNKDNTTYTIDTETTERIVDESLLPYDDLVDEKTNKILDKKIKKLGMTTTLKKMIFKSIVTATDVNDSFERLMRLSWKREQSREIVKIIVQLCMEEKCYNPFYKKLLFNLMGINKDHKYTYHYIIWDYMKVFDSYDDSELKKLHNVSKWTSQLLVSEKISLPVVLPFQFENANEKTKMFFIFIFDFYFEGSDVTKTKFLFAKWVKNDEHVEFAQKWCQFLLDEFTKEINVLGKNEKYQDNFNAAIKVLKKIW